MLMALLAQKNMTIYQCSKRSGIPYTTLSEMVHKKNSLTKCTAGSVYALAKTLDVSMEALIEASVAEMTSDVFLLSEIKRKTTQQLQESGWVEFLRNVLAQNRPKLFFKEGRIIEALYTLAMLDYISRQNNIPLSDEYKEMRNIRLEKPVYAGNTETGSVIAEFERHNLFVSL